MKYTEAERLEFAKTQKEYWPENEISLTAKIHPTAVIGKDGFGYARDTDGSLVKMPHSGNVVIEDDVEIGAHTVIDRAALGSTVIGRGTKIDNLVHCAHACKIGRHVLIVAGVVIGGSAEIGDYSYIGIGVLIKNKIKIGKNVVVGMGAVVTKDIPDGEVWVGNPAKFLRKNDQEF